MFRRFPLLLLLLLAAPGAWAERIKDLATIAGVRNNQLVGYGLVVGLTGTGDQTTQTPFTVKSLKSMLSNLGVTVPPEVNLQLKNVAAVSVQADLPPFAKPGQTIDVTVSSIGNAKSLRGGSLLMVPLKGADGAVYAIAQGNVVVGGLGAEAGGSKIIVNVPSAGRVPNGATVERQVSDSFGKEGPIVLNLRQADFTTAEPIVRAGAPADLAHYTDPLPQALVLTAIVIGFATTALFLVVLLALRGLSGSDHVDGREAGP